MSSDTIKARVEAAVVEAIMEDVAVEIDRLLEGEYRADIARLAREAVRAVMPARWPTNDPEVRQSLFEGLDRLSAAMHKATGPDPELEEDDDDEEEELGSTEDDEADPTWEGRR